MTEFQMTGSPVRERKQRTGEQQTYRILNMVTYLVAHPEGVTKNALAAVFGVSRHTIYRDLPKIEQIAPLSETPDGKIYIDRKNYQVNVRFTLHEAMAVHLAARLLSTRMDRRNQHAASALGKLGEAMEPLAPPISRQMALSARAVAAPDQLEDPAYIHALEELTESLALGRKVRLAYRGENSEIEKEYIFSPYFIEPYAIGQSTYAIGAIDPIQTLRTFKVERITRVELLSESYTIPADFDSDAYLADAWGIWTSDAAPVEVVLHFSPRVARRVQESRWHRSQQMKLQADGSLVWRAWVAAPKEMMPWIRSWGADVEVLGPPSVRADLVAEAKRLAALYSGAQ